MVLGHNFIFETEEEAREITRFLKKEKISAKIELLPDTDSSFYLYGTYSDLKNCIEEEKQEILKVLKSQENKDAGDEITVSIEECDEETDTEDLKEIEQSISYLETQKDRMEGLFSGKEIGDVVLDFNPEETEPTLEMMRTLVEASMLIKPLTKGGFVAFEEGGFIIKKIPSPDEVPFEIPISQYLQPDSEILKRHDVKLISGVSAAISYKVTAGPEIIFLSDFESLVNLLEELDVTTEYTSHAISSLLIKQRIAGFVLGFIHNTKDISTEELIAQISASSGTEDEEHALINRYSIQPEYVKQILEDFKKIGIIRMKGNRIKHLA